MSDLFFQPVFACNKSKMVSELMNCTEANILLVFAVWNLAIFDNFAVIQTRLQNGNFCHFWKIFPFLENARVETSDPLFFPFQRLHLRFRWKSSYQIISVACIGQNSPKYNLFVFQRCVTSMVYYGLSFNSGNLAGDFYLNFAASGLVEIPAYLLATYLVER